MINKEQFLKIELILNFDNNNTWHSCKTRIMLTMPTLFLTFLFLTYLCVAIEAPTVRPTRSPTPPTIPLTVPPTTSYPTAQFDDCSRKFTAKFTLTYEAMTNVWILQNVFSSYLFSRHMLRELWCMILRKIYCLLLIPTKITKKFISSTLMYITFTWY
jgi:hypothetical protein